MTNEQLTAVAMAQSARDLGAQISDFTATENRLIITEHLPANAKRYYKEPIPIDFVSYGSNVVACCHGVYREIVAAYINRFDFYHCFETPNLYELNDALEPYRQKVCFMAEYWLPDLTRLKPTGCPYTLRVLTQADFAPLYLPQWSNALCESRKQLDVLGVGAYDGDTLIGLAGCSADCDDLWQIGVDVLPEYRQKGVARALTSTLAVEILRRDKVPFYCCAWSNVRSARNAISSGFRPAWAELTVKPQ